MVVRAYLWSFLLHMVSASVNAGPGIYVLVDGHCRGCVRQSTAHSINSLGFCCDAMRDCDRFWIELDGVCKCV